MMMRLKLLLPIPLIASLTFLSGLPVAVAQTQSSTEKSASPKASASVKPAASPSAAMPAAHPSTAAAAATPQATPAVFTSSDGGRMADPEPGDQAGFPHDL